MSRNARRSLMVCRASFARASECAVGQQEARERKRVRRTTKLAARSANGPTRVCSRARARFSDSDISLATAVAAAAAAAAAAVAVATAAAAIAAAAASTATATRTTALARAFAFVDGARVLAALGARASAQASGRARCSKRAAKDPHARANQEERARILPWRCRRRRRRRHHQPMSVFRAARARVRSLSLGHVTDDGRRRRRRRHRLLLR